MTGVRRGEPLDEVPRLLLHVGDAGERDGRYGGAHREHVTRVCPHVADQRGGSDAAAVAHPRVDDLDQAALAVGAVLPDGGDRGVERRPDVDVGATLVTEHRQRPVGQREVRVERRGLGEGLGRARLHPHHGSSPRL